MPGLSCQEAVDLLVCDTLAEGRLCRREAGDWHTVRRTGDVVQADLVAERDET